MADNNSVGIACAVRETARTVVSPVWTSSLTCCPEPNRSRAPLAPVHQKAVGIAHSAAVSANASPEVQAHAIRPHGRDKLADALSILLEIQNGGRPGLQKHPPPPKP
jgi:hypothetical protein